MRSTEEVLVRVLTALVRLEMELGSEAFHDAARHSLLFIAEMRQTAALERLRTTVQQRDPKVVALDSIRRRAPRPGLEDDAPT